MYKVELKKNAISNKNIPNNAKCLLSISIEARAYDRAKMPSILRAINKTFSECTIVVGSLLDRHNYVFYPQYSMEEYINICNGTSWLRNHLYPCLHELTIPFKIIQWDYFTNHPKFKEYLSNIERLYNTDTSCNKAFNESLIEFIERRQKQLGEDYKNINQQQMINACLSYLKEEAAAAHIFAEFNCEYEIYYNKRTAVMQYVYDYFIAPNYPNLLQLITLRFKKLKNAIFTDDPLETWTLKSLLEILPGHIYWKNKDGRYLGCNKALAQYYGIKSSEEVLNKTDFELLPLKVAQRIRQNDLEIMHDESTSTVVEKNKNDYFLSIKSSIKDDLDNSIGVVGCSVNITQQKELERKLKNQIDTLSEAINVKESFLNNLSHELRTPMHIITSIVDELFDHYYQLSDEEKFEFIGMLKTTSNRASKFIKNILTMAKSRKGALSLKSETIDIVDLTKAVVSELRVISVAPITISSDKVINVKCTKFQIDQVIRNLVENAIKYGNNMPIDIIIIKNEMEVLIEVSDQGVGVPKNEILKIFEAFKESSATKSSSGGTGLGLAISKEIINLHNGKIWVEPGHNGGSRFIFTLPLVI